MPAKAEKPVPNSVKAKPVAYWLVPSQITKPPNSAAKNAPAAIPAMKPSKIFPVWTTVAKPAIAAHSIMPSAPKLTTPAFSLINKPNAAIAKTVPALSVAAIKSA
jgi:hypothetical protein